MRIGIAALLIADLLQRFGDLTAFYSDQGAMPRSLLINRVTESPWCVSIHLISGEPVIVGALLAINLVCACALLFGLRTRLFTVLCWGFLLSLQYRNPIILQGGDVLLRVVLLWGIFLPWGWHYSVVRPRSPSCLTPLLSAATAALLLQVCFVYWFSAALKNDPAWRQNYTAVYEAFSLDHFATPLAKSLLGYPRILRVLTAGSFWLEAVGPTVALLGGVVSWRVRTAAVLAFMSFHSLLALTLHLGLFPFICIVAWLAFLPSPCWDVLERRGSGLGRIIADRAPAGLIASFYSTASPASPGVHELCTPPSQHGCFRRWIAQAAAVFLLIYTLLWNLRSVDPWDFEKRFPHSWDWIGWFSGAAQVWDMFSPRPLLEGGWFVMPATLANGAEVDIFRAGGRVSWEKPAVVSGMYKNDRWRKYLVLIAAAVNTDLRPPLGRFLCERWNAHHAPEQRIANLRIILMEQNTLPERGYSAPRPIVLWSGNGAN